jgi:hypothetical protein
MGFYLRIRCRETEDSFVSYAVVAAWATVQDKEDPTKGRYVLKGSADPIVAAQLLEEAVADDAYVWAFRATDEGPFSEQLDNLLLLRGRDILSGAVGRLDPAPAVPSSNDGSDALSGLPKPTELR